MHGTYFIYPPFARATAVNLFFADAQKAHTSSAAISPHADKRAGVRLFTLEYVLVPTFLSRFVQTEKSIGCKSGDKGGHIVLSPKA